MLKEFELFVQNTELQINYNFNMVAIDHMTPHQVGLKDILRSYIEHRKQVITKRSQFDLAKAQKTAYRRRIDESFIDSG